MSLVKELNDLWNKGVTETPRTATDDLLQKQYVSTVNAMFRYMTKQTKPWQDLDFNQLQLRTKEQRFSFNNFCKQVHAHGAHVSTET